MIDQYKITSTVEDSEIELFERLKMCLMLKELLDKNLGEDFKYGWKKVDSYISEFQLRQISIAYIQVVLDTLKHFEDGKNYRDYILEINRIKNIRLGNSSVGGKIFDFRNKTFHPQSKSFSNTPELYDIYFNNLVDKCNEIITIFEKIFYSLVTDKNKMLPALFKFYESKFYKRLKKEGDNYE